jgi:hypothetical protein
VVHATYAISPNLLNEMAFNYNGNRIHILPQGVYAAPSGFEFNRLFTGPNVDSRIPAINLNGGTGTNYTSNWTPWNNAANDYQLRDDLSWTNGAHQLKFGFSWALYKKAPGLLRRHRRTIQLQRQLHRPGLRRLPARLPQQYEEDAVKTSGQWNNVSYAVLHSGQLAREPPANPEFGLALGHRSAYLRGQPTESSNFYPNLYNPANAATFDSAGFICSGPGDPVAAPPAWFGNQSQPDIGGFAVL